MIFGLYHAESETLGLLENQLKNLGLPFRDVHLYSGDGLPRDTSDLEGLIVMGGPMNVDQGSAYPFLLREAELIEKVIREGKPVLGVCLGAQLIAKALGARVYKNKVKEIGWHPIQLNVAAASDPLFKHVPAIFNVFHWHGDTFDLPQGAVHLAQSERCVNQAFRWGTNTYGFQFHLEVTPSMIRQWVNSPDGKAEIKEAGENPEKILALAPVVCEKLKPIAERIFSSYLRLAFSQLSTARF